jgi:amino acid adenylation domain-containing protein
MNLTDFVEDLEAQGVELWVHEDRLRYRGSQDLLTPEVIAQLKERKEEVMALQRERALHSRLFPVSYGQSALWFLSELAPTSFAYHVGFAAQIYSHVNVPALQRALQKMSERHAGLRTTFRKRNGIPVQEIHSNLLPGFEVIYLAPTDGATLRTKVIEAHKCPFDLERGPLLRVRLFTYTPEHHVLLLTVHHLVCDAWSLWLLLKELGDAYRAESEGATAALQPLAADYTDFVRWQRELIDNEEGERLWTYWEKQFGGEVPVLNLPTDRPRPPVQTFNGGSVSFRLDPRVTSRLRAFAAAEGTTLYMTLLATFAVLLHRYTGQEEVLLGSPTSGRTERQFADVLGDFINTVVVRSSVAGDPGFRAYLDRFSKVALEAIAHERFPFSLLAERLRIGRDPSRSYLFQVLFNYLKPQKFQDVIELSVSGKTGDLVEWGGLSLGPFALPQQEGQVDLALEMIEGKTSLLGMLKYNVDLFDSATIERMAVHFGTLLEGIVAEPGRRLSELPVLTEAEKHRLLVEWNQTGADVPPGRCIHDLLEERVERTPQAVALIGPSLTRYSLSQVSWTYAELSERADELAHYLQALGVGPEVLVAVCTERTVEMVVGLLAVLKAGGAYVPLDPAYPPERLAFILEETQAPVVLTQQSIAAFLPNHQARVVCLDDPNLPAQIQKLAGNDFRFSTKPQDPSHLAYVLYTSGSTGKPKGVEICHRAVVNFLNSMRAVPGIEMEDTLLSVTSLSFDIFGLELWLPLTTGAKVVIASEAAVRDGRELAALMKRSGATVMQATPSTWRLLLESRWEGNPHLKILCGGEAWPAQLAEQLLPKCGSLWNMYGPAETTIWSAVDQVREGRPVLLGRPIANTQFYVVDSYLQAVPVGVPGELLIGGDGLARGYLNRPELTAEKFIANPFSTESSSRLYRTGDLVRHLPDGDIEFLGRIDQQVKIRGFRIELGEIESILRTHAGVRETVVMAQEDEREKRLVAYIVRSNESNCTAAELRHHLQERLPDYMVPTAFVFLAALPLTPNGKVNRKALPSPEDSRADLETGWVPPATEAEQVIARVWEELLGLSRVGRNNNFFDLGGHSLLLMRVRNKLEQAFARQLPMVEMFRHPTVRSLAGYLTDHEAQAATLVRNREQIARHKESARRRLRRRKQIAITESQPT